LYTKGVGESLKSCPAAIMRRVFYPSAMNIAHMRGRTEKYR
jgi:hypothetical protein